MRVYLAAVGAATSPTLAVASIERIWREEGDSLVQYRCTTSGTLSRQHHIENFLESECDALFMLDTDMLYPANCLRQLRGHELPIVSGLYVRRDTAEPLPAAWEEPLDVEEFPLLPLLDLPDDGLVAAGAVGHGFLLIQRHVVEEMQEAFGNDPWMLRAPMEDWTGVPGLHVGPDVRMSVAVRRLGYRIWLDCGCRAGHYSDIVLEPQHFLSIPDRKGTWRAKTGLARIVRRTQMGKNVTKQELALLGEQVFESRKQYHKQRDKLLEEGRQFEQRFAAKLREIDNFIAWHDGRMAQLEDIVKAMDGKLEIARREAGAGND